MMEIVAVLLIAFDRPVGGGAVSFVARFDSESVRPISAAFLVDGAEAPDLEWYLDGNGLLAPLAVSKFVPRPEPGDPPGLLSGEYLFAHQGVTKPTYFRGVIRSSPPRDVRLLLLPPDHFDAAWKALDESGLVVCLSGELPGLRPLLERHGVAWREADLSKPDTVDRTGLLVVQLGDSKQIPIPGMAKYMAIFDTGSLAFNRFFESKWEDRVIVFDGPVSDFAAEPLVQQLLFQLTETNILQ